MENMVNDVTLHYGFWSNQQIQVTMCSDFPVKLRWFMENFLVKVHVCVSFKAEIKR